jgi:hypothetical protein
LASLGFLVGVADSSPLVESLLGYLLILGVGGPILGPAAWIMGSHALRQIRAGVRDPIGTNRAKDGLICGMIATVLFVLGAIILAIGILLAIMGSQRLG